MAADEGIIRSLPQFMREYEEMRRICGAEDPELRACWEAAARVEDEAFIATADSDGLARYERMLRLSPEPGDATEARRTRALSKWTDSIPYTYRVLLKRLDALCGGRGRYSVDLDAGSYRITVRVEPSVDVGDGLGYVLETMLPANLARMVRFEFGFELDHAGEGRPALPGLAARSPLPFWGARLLDGSLRLDGGSRLDSERRHGTGARASARLATKRPSERLRGAGVAVSRHPSFLDGRDVLDGSRLLDAIYREEEI